MIPHQRLLGLQPERTALAWLRTFLLMIVIGILLFKAGTLGNNLLIQINAIIFIGFAVFFYYASKKRFSNFFRHARIVSDKDATVKKILSMNVFITASLYGVVMLVKLSAVITQAL